MDRTGTLGLFNNLFIGQSNNIQAIRLKPAPTQTFEDHKTSQKHGVTGQ